MLHMRVVTPTELTEQIVEMLIHDSAVSNVAVFAGSSVKPAGDVLEVEVAREGVNEIIDELRDLGVHRFGSVQIARVPTWMSQKAFDAERVTPGASADAVVWSEVTQQAYEDSEFNWTFSMFMFLATLLCAIAILLNSTILLIGAMVLGPEFGAVAALGVALVRRRFGLLRRAVATLSGGFVLAIVATTIFASIARALGWITVIDVVEARPDTEFIYSPDKWSFIVAMLAGAAGVLSLTSARLGGLSGVFISVTTIPAAGNMALGITFGLGGTVVGSLAQLLINLAGMAVAGWLTLALQQASWQRLSAYRARVLKNRSLRQPRPPEM
ncbi:DUF389 domain-containing protein [Williamsia muralis]|uniref:Hydrophobic protein (TIGR00271 family) n=1 Tax=Williamsia marianensis TaxID=85044 RepID=A0A2G3PHD0_WILMA|nr:DUF389 domain-containing protein [Williamsia marianensis]PHV65219.1 hypothetical protein CSW57_15525 [Williamsia marianensis]PZT98260.1 MAG: DUF389 domain-containing protein [Gordonia sp. (in: high G+C Gram-positive bacteria)]